MILEDTATNEQLAVTKVRKLVTQDKVDVVFGGITSSMRNAIKDTIVNRGKTLYIYPQLYEGKECTPYLFCTGPDAGAAVRHLHSLADQERRQEVLPAFRRLCLAARAERVRDARPSSRTAAKWSARNISRSTTTSTAPR